MHHMKNLSKPGEARMIGLRKAALCMVLFAVVGFYAAPACAGLLSTGTPYGTWSGSTNFVGIDNPDLSGHIDWVVFGPGDYPFSDEDLPLFTPTSGELTYVYQVFCEGTDAISLSLHPWATPNTADNVGAFVDTPNGVTGDPATDMGLIPEDSVYWVFAGIEPGNNSEGLVYCSPNVPQNWYSVIINGGTVAIVDPIPVPSSTPIPEPAVLWSLIVALGTFGAWCLRRR
jgi:hypothetical protein